MIKRCSVPSALSGEQKESIYSTLISHISLSITDKKVFGNRYSVFGGCAYRLLITCLLPITDYLPFTDYRLLITHYFLYFLLGKKNPFIQSGLIIHS